MARKKGKLQTRRRRRRKNTDRKPPMAFALRIRAARERLGLSQIEFASQCGVNQVTAWRWERSNQIPKLHVLLRVAQVLGEKPESLAALAPGAGR